MPRLATKTIRKNPRATNHFPAADFQRERGVLVAVEEEHARIAQELHDTICQSLSGLRLSAAALRRKSGEHKGQAVTEFAHLEEAAAKAIGELHEIVRQLQPVEVLPADLPVALEEVARENRGPIECEFRRNGRPAIADQFSASQIARIARAAARHARATDGVRKIVIEWQEAPGGSILYVIADQPCFTARDKDVDRLLGWNLLQRRVAAIGAVLTIAHDGASMQVAIPALDLPGGSGGDDTLPKAPG